MFGAMLAASEPVPVLAGMEEIGAGRRLITFTSAESIMNEGLSDLLLTPCCGAVFQDEAIRAGELVSFTAQNTLGDVTLGVWSLFDSVLVLKRCWIVFARTSRQR